MIPEPYVLFVDDEEELRFAAEQTLQLAEIDVRCFAYGEEALSHIARDRNVVLVSDLRMPQMDGQTLMTRALEIDPTLPVILVTGHGDVELAVRSMRDGAYDFLEKPYDPNRLVDTVRRALEKRRLTLENRALRRDVGRRDAIEARLTGRSAVMIALRQQLRAVAQTDVDVLILGDTGTGKEVAARALHKASARAAGPFVHVNCAALPAQLIESELFGHEAGAFVGAVRPRYGKFEHGRGGTVFLDEIDSLPLELQPKLLNAIQNRVVTRLGSNELIPLETRFVAASKTDLAQAAAQGTFRADLYYRLNVATLEMPPLEARREDIALLFQELVNETAARYHKSPPRIPGAVLAALSTREWPGHVRELRNVAERFALGLEDVARLPAQMSGLADQLAAHERAILVATLTAHRGDVTACYTALGLSRRSFYDKLQKYGLDRQEFSFGPLSD